MKDQDGGREVKFNPLAIVKDNPKATIAAVVIFAVIIILAAVIG